jgi:hypothetical protein
MRSLAVVAILAMARSPEVYSVSLQTSGGFTGRGTGSLTVTGDGTVRLSRVTGGACDGMQAPAYLVTKLGGAVRAAQPAEWKERYVDPANPEGCCDQITTTLTLDRAGKSHRTGWFDDSRKLAPPDAQAVAEATRAIYDALAPSCKAPGNDVR